MKKSLIIGILLLLIVGVVYRAYASSVGPSSPGTMADDATVGTVAWTNPDNAKVSDNVYATATINFTQPHYLKATNFGFSIPAGATINGVVVEVERKVTGTSNWVVEDSSVNGSKLVKNGTISGSVLSGGGRLTGTDTYVSLGSSTSLSGNTFTPDDINNSGFGAVYHVIEVDGSGDQVVYVDHIRITVYFSSVSGTPQVQIRSGQMNIRSGQVIIK